MHYIDGMVMVICISHIIIIIIYRFLKRHNRLDSGLSYKETTITDTVGTSSNDFSKSSSVIAPVYANHISSMIPDRSYSTSLH